MTEEKRRLIEDRSKKQNWRKFGPYLSERQWGTGREDYSPDWEALEHISHDHARSKAFRWGEECIGGISDDQLLLNFSLALWNTKDPILKERMFGLTGKEGNHGEDCKDHYYYLDNTPSHSYMKMLYKYPQKEFPYSSLVSENRKRDRSLPEYDLIDTGIFNEDRYFDVFIEYAKASPTDLLITITAFNRGPVRATLHLLPQLWFRNTWSWGYHAYKPAMSGDEGVVQIEHEKLGEYFLYYDGNPQILFCENETNSVRLYGQPSEGTFKDGINDCIVNGDCESVNSSRQGTKAAVHYKKSIQAGQCKVVRLRLCKGSHTDPFADHDELLNQRKAEADEFYDVMQQGIKSEDERNIQRQAFAGMLWSKQFYYYDVDQWLKGDPAQPPPPAERASGRNSEWRHLNNADVISMPDKWEYPWYAAWDLAFHTIPFSMIDP